MLGADSSLNRPLCLPAASLLPACSSLQPRSSFWARGPGLPAATPSHPTHPSLALRGAARPSSSTDAPASALTGVRGQEELKDSILGTCRVPSRNPRTGEALGVRGEFWGGGGQEQRCSARAACSPGTGSRSVGEKMYFGIKISLMCTEETGLSHRSGKHQSHICHPP